MPAKIPDPEGHGLDLKIDVRNFGPISTGRIDLKPLTIFAGANNSGKSYAAMLVYSIIKSRNPIPFPRTEHELDFLDQLSSLKLSFLDELKKLLEEDGGDLPLIIPHHMTNKLEMGVRNSFESYLESEIIRNFESPVERLVTIGGIMSKIKMSDSPATRISIRKKFSLKFDPDTKIRYKITAGKIPNKIPPDTVIIMFPDGYDPDLFCFHATDKVASMITDRVMPQITCRPYYFPASRSGMFKKHGEPITSAAENVFDVVRPPVMGMTGAAMNFLSDIHGIKDNRGHFYDLAMQLDRDIFHGRLSIRTFDNKPPVIKYMLKGTVIPLHLTSSTISELAPISLCLKHVIRPGNILIIEEPEAHLHARNQLILARYIVKMIRAGLNVLITTHSELLLEELGKFVLAGDLDKGQRRKAGFDPSEYLRHDEVSPHIFENIDGIRHTIRNVGTDKHVGISQDEFMQVVGDMHNRHIKLQELLETA